MLWFRRFARRLIFVQRQQAGLDGSLGSLRQIQIANPCPVYDSRQGHGLKLERFTDRSSRCFAGCFLVE